VEQFQIALRLDPKIALGHYHLGFAYASLGKNHEAIAEYEKEMAHSPENPDLVYELGHSLLETGDWKSAVVHLRRATHLNPQNAESFYDLGKTLLLQGDPQAAIPALRRAIDLNPRDPSPHYQLARSLDKIGNVTEAKQEWQRFSELRKSQQESGGMATGRVH